MYENGSFEQRPDTDRQQMYQAYPVGQMPGANGYPAGSPAPAPREEKPAKPGFFRKLMLSVSLGLFFGIFAGIGFYAAYQGMVIAQKVKPDVQVEEPVKERVKEKEKEEKPEDSTVKAPSKSEKEEEDVAIQQVNAQPYAPYAVPNVSAIVEKVMPAMVSIVNNYTEKTVFWGQIYEEDVSFSGSGIIVSQNDNELLIVTNNHVVADAEELIVTMIDGSEVEAKIKGVDEEMDLAVIAIPLKDIKQKTKEAIAVATLGNSDDLLLGEQVIAIGNALGYGQSVTVGYVSALDREIQMEDGDHRKFIQTDAAINPGNSGGALLNSMGEVIGINSNKIGGSVVEGMGYAIPITTASPIIAELMERQTRYKVSDADRGYIGISRQDVTEQIAMMYGIPKGVYILSVVEGSAADKAGIVKGDVIVEFDGNKITCDADLQAALQYCAIGDVVEITVLRPENGEYVEYEMELTLGEKPASSR